MPSHTSFFGLKSQSQASIQLALGIIIVVEFSYPHDTVLLVYRVTSLQLWGKHISSDMNYGTMIQNTHSLQIR